MREIKFRAWDKKNNEWCQSIEQEGFGVFINGVVNPSKSGEFYIHDYSSTGQEYIVLCQFTGLHDKNGREIYEGDVVQTYNGKHKGPRVEIAYLEHSFCMREEPDDSRMDCVWYFNIEVIGNIYENPELLEGK